MKVSAETVEIARDIQSVFNLLSDFANVDKLFEHVENVSYTQEKPSGFGSQYQQTRIVHGQRYSETVAVIAFERASQYSLKVSSYGVDTIYAYSLEPLGAQLTRVQLTKYAEAPGWRKLFLPLAYHLLTRPEHDGRHLQVLKAFIERN